MSLIIRGNSIDLGRVREERANKPAGDLYGGNLVTQETETPGKVDAGIGDDGDIGASLRWADTASADNNDWGDILGTDLSGWSSIKERKHSPPFYWCGEHRW